MHTRAARPGRATILALAAALAMAIPGTAVAGSPTIGVDQGTGKHGEFGYDESPSEPAGTCRYGYDPAGEVDDYNGLRRIVVEPPFAFARAGRTSQRISMRLVVQAWVSAESRWIKVGATAWQSRRTNPVEAALFTKHRLTIDSWPHHGEYSPYRGKVELRWYATDDVTVVGRARLFPDLYRAIQDGIEFTVHENDCGGTTG
jgi:hypothetical protein